MKFLVISTPHPSKPNEMREPRMKFKAWIEDLKAKSKVVCSYPRVGRGSIVIFDVSSNDELHELATEWGNIVPAHFDVYALATPEAAAKALHRE